jgi:transcriptional regulator with XRE-family HTH domain
MKPENRKPAVKSRWAEKADYRIRNRKWLGYSGSIARRLLAAIEDRKESIRGYNQGALAAEINVTPQYISKVAKGHENLSLETIAKLSDALGVELISFPEYKHSAKNYTNCLTVAIDAKEYDTKNVNVFISMSAEHAVEAFQSVNEVTLLENEVMIA